MPNPDNISLLYKELENTYDLGSEDDFRNYLSDSGNREALRKELESEYDVGDENAFSEYLGFGQDSNAQGGNSMWDKISGMSAFQKVDAANVDESNIADVPQPGQYGERWTEEQIDSIRKEGTPYNIRDLASGDGKDAQSSGESEESTVTASDMRNAATEAVGGGALQGAQGVGSLSGQQQGQQSMTDDEYMNMLTQDTDEGRAARRNLYETLKSEGRGNELPKTYEEFEKALLAELSGGSHPINPHPKENAQNKREMTDAEYNAFVNNLKADDENGRKARLSFYEMLQKKGEKNLPSTFDEFEKALMAEFAAEEASKGKNPAMVSPIQDEQGYSGWNLLSEVPAYASAPSEGNYMMIPTQEELDKQRQLREGFMLNDALEHVVAQQERFEREGIAGNAEPIKGIAVPPQKTNRMSEAARSGSTRLMNGQMANNGELEDRMTEYYRNIVETYVAAANGDAKALETAMQWNQKNALDLLQLEGYGLNIDEQPDENGVYRKTKGFVNQAVLNVIIPRAEAMAAYVLNGLGNPPMNIASRLRRIYYDRAIQQSLKDEIHYSGIDYQWYVENIMFPAMRRVSKQKFGYDVMKYSDVLFVKPDDVREQMEVGEADALNRKYVSDGLDKVFAAMDAKSNESIKKSIENFEFPLIGLRKANEPYDYEEAMKGVMEESVKYFVDMVHDPRYLKEAQALADRAGVDLTTYVMDYALNGFMDSLQGRFMEMAVLKEMPREKWSYVWGGVEESILGMVISAMTRPESQRKVRSEALAMTEMGENPYIGNEAPGMGWRGLRTGTNMLADAWLWFGAGKLGGAMARRWLLRRREALKLLHGCSTAEAERLLFAEGEKYLGKQMADKAIQGALSMSTTLGTATAVTETTRGITSGENVGTAIWQGLTAGGKEYLKGLILGAFIGTGGTLTRNLKGKAKAIGKTMAFGGEGFGFYALNEFEKSLNGEDSFQNIGEGWVDSMVNLLFIKASGNPQEFFPSLFRTIRSPKRAYKTSTADLEKAKRAQAGIDDIHLTSDDIKWLKSEYGGKTFLDALEALRPSDKDYAYQGVEGRERQAPVNREKARKAAEEYAKLMSNPDIPADRKQR
ncbi:MAG: hypothetical protein J5510_07715, partial [Prevotella sp.]|nr:hypothetical protein [Prevotella sp.]